MDDSLPDHPHPMESHFLYDDPAVSPPENAPLPRDNQCPWCGEDNQCRVTDAHPDEEACGCHVVLVPDHLLRRLVAENINPACLCRPCLETIGRLAAEFDEAEDVLAEAKRVTNLKHDYYLDERGNVVFTSRYHLKRGTCCGSGCRHCPY